MYVWEILTWSFKIQWFLNHLMNFQEGIKVCYYPNVFGHVGPTKKC